jgi:hypothetical protein
MFEIYDPENEIPEEQKERVAEMAEGILDVISDVSDNPIEATQAMSAVMSLILAEGFPARSGAINCLQIMVGSIIETLNDAERDGKVAWNKKLRH